MRHIKIVLVFVVLFGSLFILPTKAEEIPETDIVQSEDGDESEALASIELSDSDDISLDQALTTPIFEYYEGISGKLLIWMECGDLVDGCEVQYSTKKNGKYKATTEYSFVSGAISSYKSYINKPKTGKKYYIRARSYIYVAGTKEYSEWATTTIKQETGPVKNIVMKLTGPNKMSVSWKKAKKATKYNYEVIGYRAGTKAIYDDFVTVNDPSDFDWSLYMEKIMEGNTKKRKLTVDLNNIDLELSINIAIDAFKGNKFGQAYRAVSDDEFCKPVEVIGVVADSARKNVVFNFKPTLDLTGYKLMRRDFGGDYGTSTDNSSGSSISALDMWQQPTVEPIGLYDFNLFVSTKKNGTYKRVKTTADFSDLTNMKLTYKAKRGKKLFYKILPTVDSTFKEGIYFPKIHDRTNITYYVNLINPAEIREFKLTK